MTIKTPTVRVRFEAAPRALDATPRMLLLGPIGTGGTASASQVYRVQSVDDAAALFAASDLVDAIRLAFDANLQRTYEIYALGFSTSGWTANVWEVTVTGTAAAAGGVTFRFGDYTVPVSFAKDDTAPGSATKLAAALTASSAPLTVAVDGTVNTQVNVTSTYKGAHIQRLPVSVELYRDRGELGVEGLAFAITNNADATGTPTFSSTPLVESFDHYLHPFRTTAFLDALEAYLETRWQDANNYAHAFTPLAGSQSSAATFGAARNDRHQTYLDISDAPIQELSAAVVLIDGVIRAIERAGTPNISGQKLELLRMPLPATPHDSETLLEAGVSPLRVRSATVSVVRLVASYRETGGVEDLSQYDIGTVLALAAFGNELNALIESRVMGKAIVAAGTPLSPKVAKVAISEAQVRTLVIDLLKDLWSRAIIFASSESVLDQVVANISTTEAGGIVNGFELQLEPTIVRHVTFFDALVRYL
jgi:phage tail sheath gpL-like